jgi:creatinine amidohydrolase
MQWENLSSLDFETAVAQSQGVGIIPFGVIEAHGPHMPLGTDMFTAHWVACRAAERETAVVFPAYPFGTNVETAHLPGGLVIKRELIMALLENICDEMYRNGLHKIILISGHGGNRFFLPFFVQTLPEKRKPYVVYFVQSPYFPADTSLLETPELGHACEWEASLIRYINDDLVKLDQAPAEPFTNLRRNEALTAVGAYSQVDWYSMYPHMVVGDARPATAEKGRIYLEEAVAALTRAIQTIKADAITPQLVAEFNARMDCPQAPAFWTNRPSIPITLPTV